LTWSEEPEIAATRETVDDRDVTELIASQLAVRRAESAIAACRPPRAPHPWRLWVVPGAATLGHPSSARDLRKAPMSAFPDLRLAPAGSSTVHNIRYWAAAYGSRLDEDLSALPDDLFDEASNLVAEPTTAFDYPRQPWNKDAREARQFLREQRTCKRLSGRSRSPSRGGPAGNLGDPTPRSLECPRHAGARSGLRANRMLTNRPARSGRECHPPGCRRFGTPGRRH